MQNIKLEIDRYILNQEFKKAIEVLTELINKENNADQWLILRGNVYNLKQEYAKALNDYNKVLKLDPKNKDIKSKVEMIKDILKFQALDIYASTNLNKDPWLED